MAGTTLNQPGDEPAGVLKRAGGWEVWFTIAVSLALAIATLVYVFLFALPSPWADELRWVPQAAGEQPVTIAWLIQSENGHRMPLIKLAYLGLGRATGFDFRLIALFSTLLLAAAALIMVVAIARARGRASPIDILIPVLLLNWGHYTNLLWGFQLCYTMSTAMACMILLLMSADRLQASVARAAGVSACAITAAFCGGPGIFFLPPAVAWLAYAGVRRWRESRAASAGILLLAACTLAPLTMWLGTVSDVQNAASATESVWVTMLHGALEFLSMSLGKFGGETHPVSGLIVLAIVLFAAGKLWQAWYRHPEQRLRAAGLGLFLGGAIAMALGIGLTRGSIGCLQTRYSLLGAPLIACLYLVAACYGPRTQRTMLRWSCAAALLVLAVAYDVKGERLARDMRWNVLRMEASVREGLPVNAVAARHWEDMQDHSAESFAKHLEMMRSANIGPYRRGLARNPTRESIVLPLVPLESPRRPGKLKMVHAKEPYVQPFVAGSDLPLSRIDLEVSPLRGAAGQFHWKIDEIDPGGQRRTRAKGEWSLEDSADPGYAHLIFAPFSAAPGSHLELRVELQLVPDGAGTAPLRLPLHRRGGDTSERAIRAFAYYDGEMSQ